MGAVTISDFRGAQEALKQPHLRQSLYDAGGVIMDGVLLTLHGDEHMLRRTTEFRVFGRNFFRYYEREVFPATLSQTIAPYLKAGRADLVECGYRVTMNLTADFAGVDRPDKTPEETERLLRLVRTFGEGATIVHSTRDHDEVRAEVRAGIAELTSHFLEGSEARRRALVEAFERGEISEDDLPRDVMTILIRDRERLNLSPEVFRREMAFYLQAGAHSTSNSTTHALHDIFEWCDAHPDDWARIHKDPIFLQRCVHESLRLHPASPVAGRQAVCPFALSESQDVAEGDDVVVDLFKANRDKEIFGDDAEAFNPYRTLPNNVWPFGLTFGYGVHACLGRDLDGGVAPRKAVDPDAHQYGIVTLFIRELLRHGARRDPATPPQRDAKTERPNWGAYPLVFEHPQL